jgi:hypothetical protein
LILSLTYTKAQGDVVSIADDTELKDPFARNVMYQPLAINTIIIAMDVALLAVKFAN